MAALPNSKRHRGPEQWCISQRHASELQNHGPKYLKILISNFAAGVLLGDKGSDLRQVEQSTGCCIKVSPMRASYPGTAERVVALSGEQAAIEAGAASVIGACNTALQNEADREGTDHKRSHLVVYVAVPNSACGLVIGKQGSIQKEMSKRLGVPLQISKTGENMLSTERLLTIGGAVDAVSTAVCEVSRLIQTDPELPAHLATPTAEGMGSILQSGGGAEQASPLQPAPEKGKGKSDWGKGGGCWQSKGDAGKGDAGKGDWGKGDWGKGDWGKGDAGPGHRFVPVQTAAPQQQGYSDAWSGAPQGAGDDLHCSIYFDIGEIEAGHVIGKGGSYHSTIQQQTGAKVVISKKGEYIPGTQARQVVISGPMAGVHAAHAMVLHRVAEVVIR